MPDESEGAEPNADDAAIGDSDGADPSSGQAKAPRRRRAARRLFPAMSFEEALTLANAIQEHGSGQPIRRLTLFEALDRSPDSGPTRKLITSSGQYGITKGAYNAETLSLTPLGTSASDPNAAPATKLAARAQLAILGIAPFNAIYEQYKDSRLPAIEVLRDAARTADVQEDEVAECVETFLANAREIGLIRNIGGSEHLISIEAAVDEVSAKSGQSTPPTVYRDDAEVEPQLESRPARRNTSPASLDSLAAATTNLADTCFVISPIGDTDSTERKHADLVLSTLIEPALSQLGLIAVRADKIRHARDDHRPGHRPCLSRQAGDRRLELRQSQRLLRACSAPCYAQAHCSNHPNL